MIEAAVGYADKNGTESLSMRVLAKELSCGVMSLYNHVSNKDDLFAGMVEYVARKFDPPTEDKNWKQAIRSIAISAHHTFMAHPWVMTHWSHHGPGPAKLRHMESILRVFREAGFSVASACRGYHAVTMHIDGFTFQKLDFPIKENQLRDAAATFLAEHKEEDSPYFFEHVRHHLTETSQNDDFVFMLDLILQGLEQHKHS